MSSPSSRAPGAASSAPSSSASEPSATASATPTVKRSSKRAFETAYLILPRSLEMSERFSDPATATASLDEWMSSAPASLVSPSPSPGSDSPTPTSATSGPRLPTSFAEYDPDSRSWKTSQGSLLTPTSESFSGTWPRSGSMRNGRCSERTIAAPRTGGSDCGFWPTPQSQDARHNPGNAENRMAQGRQIQLAHAVRWPTPSAGLHHSNKGGSDPNDPRGWSRNGPERLTLVGMAARNQWPTPISRDSRTIAGAARMENSQGTEPLAVVVGGLQTQPTKGLSLNPAWVGWLMGWPVCWEALEPLAPERFLAWLEAFRTEWTGYARLEMDRFQQPWCAHGGSSTGG